MPVCDRVLARDRRGREGREPHRRRDVAHDPVVEDEQVHGDQRDDEPALRAELDDHRRHQRRHQDVVGGRRHAQAEHQADERGEQQHHASRCPGETNSTNSVIRRPRPVSVMRADDDAGRGAWRRRCRSCCARRRSRPLDEVAKPWRERRRRRRRRGRAAISGAASSISDHQRDDRPERGERRRHLLDHQAPDQRADRDRKCRPARTVGQVSQRLRVVDVDVLRQVGVARRLPRLRPA